MEIKKTPRQERQGLVMLYTGNGKGKTTAALGLALRALGHDERVIIIQFMKGNPDYGEIVAVRRYLPVEIAQFGPGRFVKKGRAEEVDLELARKGLEKAREAVSGGEYDLVILDEINVAVDFGLLDEADVLKVIEERLPTVDLVLTGRYASEGLVERADMVSEVREVKHHFHRGIAARSGIEF